MPTELADFLTPNAVLAASLAFASLLLLVALRRGARASGAATDAERHAAKAAERAAIAERELRDARSAPRGAVEGARRALADLPDALRETAEAGSRRDLADRVGRAIERLLAPQQWMVFVDMQREGREFVLTATGSVTGKTWSVGAVLTPQTGRVGLAIRRCAVLDTDDLAAEPPIVRRQVEDTEPKAFLVDVVAPLHGTEDAVGALTVGGSEAPSEVVRAVLASLAECASSVLRFIDARDRATRLENEDEATGLGQRSWFTAQASEALFRDRDRGVPMSVGVFGIDHFRLYMNREGPGETRRLLQAVARLLRPHFADGELLCRWAEDEFAVLLPGRTRTEASHLLDLVRRQIATQRFHGSRRQPDGAVTISVGVATSPDDGSQLDDLVDCAYRAFQRSRARGGDATTADVGEAAAEVAAMLDSAAHGPPAIDDRPDDVPAAWRD